MFLVLDAQGQCAMCTKTAMDGIKEGRTTSAGINRGILYLLSMPYVLIVGVGATWWYNKRKQDRDDEEQGS